LRLIEGNAEQLRAEEQLALDLNSAYRREDGVLRARQALVLGVLLSGDYASALQLEQLNLEAFRATGAEYPTEGRAVFDEASGLPVFMSSRSGRTDAFDVARRAWRTLVPAPAGSRDWCDSMPPAYDPLNGRIVCLEAGVDGFLMGRGTYPNPGVSALSTATGEWRWLLEPSTTPPSAPMLAPGATPVDWGTPPPGWQSAPEPTTNPNPPAP
jgi:hypothetical protein